MILCLLGEILEFGVDNFNNSLSIHRTKPSKYHHVTLFTLDVESLYPNVDPKLEMEATLVPQANASVLFEHASLILEWKNQTARESQVG